MKNKSLEEHLNSHRKNWKDLLRHKNDSDRFFEQLHNLNSDILSIDVNKTYDILLSWGGPSDGFKVDTDQDNELTNVRYWYADWGTYEERKLDGKERDSFLSVYGGVLESYGIKY